MNKIILLSPLDQFEVINLLGINAPIFNFFNLSLTNFALYSIFTFLIIFGLHYYGDNNSNLVPNK